MSRRWEVELLALRHGSLPVVENAGDIKDSVVVLWRRRWLSRSMMRWRWTLKREVSVAEEARHPPRILLGLASESCFFFPMVMRQRAVVRVGAEVSVVWAMAGTMSDAF